MARSANTRTPFILIWANCLLTSNPFRDLLVGPPVERGPRAASSGMSSWPDSSAPRARTSSRAPKSRLQAQARVQLKAVIATERAVGWLCDHHRDPEQGADVTT
jgi:hypothetical protein